MIRKGKFFQKYRLYYNEEKIYTTLKEKIKICRIPLCCYACGKLFKKDLIKNLNFKEGVFFEDVIWTPIVLDLSIKLVTVPDTIYWYRVNRNSIVKKIPDLKKQTDLYNAKKFAINYLLKREIKFSKKLNVITKETKYFFNVPILKTKEFNNILDYYFLGFLKIPKIVVKIFIK